MNFHLGSDSASKNVSDILRDVPVTDDYSKKSVNLGFHVHALEEEMKKIEAFKRELPHCMHLLRDAIERLKEESGGEVVVEELGFEGRAKASNDMMEKKTWMSSVQLCTPVSRNQDSVFQLRSRYLEGEGSGNGEFRKEGGAFLPFKKGTAGIEELSLSVGEGGDLTLNGFGREKLEQPHQQEQQKKQRRCWSPELHKIFVDALHQLGGAQTATPKQIRELMKVDGLTNDEVKSHLQKYRIHIKRVGAGEQIAGSPKGPLQGGKAGRGGGDSLEDEDDGKSESHGWTSCKLQNPNL